MAMALRAGAALLDMEFMQFHPTALSVAGAPPFLVSEAVRGEGARLLNAAQERFTEELGPRDQVARAIHREQQEGRGPVCLDLRHLDPERVKRRFPRIHATCLRYGIDITRDLVPVTPAAHYAMGGVASDLHGRATLPGLYAAGETAATGVHGANRLASNSLLEGLVFGARAAEAMIEDRPSPPRDDPPSPLREVGPSRAPSRRESLRDRAWRRIGLERDAAGLRDMLGFLAVVRRELAGQPAGERAAVEDRNLADVAFAIATAALFREESRGSHFRTDFPRADERFLGHTWLVDREARLVDLDLPETVGTGA
jgi:L-aspartate oxidase